MESSAWIRHDGPYIVEGYTIDTDSEGRKF